MTKPPQFFSVPRLTRPSQCRSCKSEIFWIITDSGARMPVDCDPRRVYKHTASEGAKAPTDTASGRGVSHFATCPNAAQHRKRA